MATDQEKEILLRQREDGKWEEYKVYASIDCPTKEDYDRLLELVEQGKRMQWHPADVELPTDVELKEFCDSVGEWPMYLVMISGAEFPTTLYYDGNTWFDEAYNGHVEIYRVTHWMPLPAAPKEGEQA